MATRELNPTEVRTDKVRFSYAHVWEPKVARGATKAKYSVSIVIKKTDKVTLNAVKSALEAAKAQFAEKYGGGKVPANLKLPIHDGDKERPEDPVYAGCFYLNASSDLQPGIVDNSRPPQKITNPDDFYSGCYGRAFVNFFPFNNQSKGIGCGLNHVQKLEDGERLGGRADLDTAFGDWGGEAEDFGSSEDMFK